jgi:hypothetical protein
MYAVIARNWHIAFLSLDVMKDDQPIYWFEEVPEEVMDWRGNSLTVERSFLYSTYQRQRRLVRGEPEPMVHD